MTMLAILVALAGAALAAPSDSVLAGGGEPYAIVVRTNASEVVRYAAAELGRFVHEQTGVSLSVTMAYSFSTGA